MNSGCSLPVLRCSEVSQAMSQLGHEPPRRSLAAVTASLPIAAAGARGRGGRLGPGATIRIAAKKSLFDHFISQQLHRFGDRKTKGFSRLHVDHKFNLGRLLDRQIGWLSAEQ